MNHIYADLAFLIKRCAPVQIDHFRFKNPSGMRLVKNAKRRFIAFRKILLFQIGFKFRIFSDRRDIIVKYDIRRMDVTGAPGVGGSQIFYFVPNGARAIHGGARNKNLRILWQPVQQHTVGSGIRPDRKPCRFCIDKSESRLPVGNQ